MTSRLINAPEGLPRPNDDERLEALELFRSRAAELMVQHAVEGPDSLLADIAPHEQAGFLPPDIGVNIELRRISDTDYELWLDTSGEDTVHYSTRNQGPVLYRADHFMPSHVTPRHGTGLISLDDAPKATHYQVHPQEVTDIFDWLATDAKPTVFASDEFDEICDEELIA